uniref:Secreted RxLR effector protein 105 n=1 Tax=Plasmopara viticola TaxID=143451 RepID=RL105_PLAVT|nr:RecName: Full=Secreted RxLR effector protein 105; Flags: Precursor [Plasmopara viticola]
MRGPCSVITALLVVASSQIAAESDYRLQAYHHDVTAVGNAVVKPLPKRYLRGSQHVLDSNEERSVYSVLASMINEGVSKMPQAAEAVEKMPQAAEAVEKMPQAAEAVEKMPQAAEAVEKMPQAAEAVEKMPSAAMAGKKVSRVTKTGKKMPHAAEIEAVEETLHATNARKEPLRADFVEEMPHAAKAKEEMRRAKQHDLLRATEEADEALEKSWHSSEDTAAIGGASRGISSNVILSLKKWKNNFQGMRAMAVSGEHEDIIKPIHEAFVRLCGENMEPTTKEMTLIRNMLDWDVAASPESSHRQNLVSQAQRHVLIGLRIMQRDPEVWNEWNELSESLRFGVLDYLLNLHYQRWVRMYNIFKRHRPDKKDVPMNDKLSLGGNTDKNSALALQTHSKKQNLYPDEPSNVAWTSKKRDGSVLIERSKRTFNGNTDTASVPYKQLKMQSLKPVMPFLTRSTTSGHHSVSIKNPGLSFDGPIFAFVPPNVHKSQSLTPPLVHKDVDTELSLGGIYDRSTHKAPTVP